MHKKLKIGLALGSGSSRGWAHIGIIRELAELGINPEIICGTSVGSMVGASYVANNLDKLEDWACSLTKFEAARYFDINLSLNGFVDIKKFHDFLNEYVASDTALIQDYEKQYAAVATDLETGREVWLMKDSIVEAVWSSMSMPGLFPAINNNNRWLVDGGLVNPVSVSACRALGADIVIAVNLNSDLLGRHRRAPRIAAEEETKEIIKPSNHIAHRLTELVKDYSSQIFSNTPVDHQPPGLLDANAGSINITQDRITRSRMAGDPADIILSPKLANIGLLEVYRATEAIEGGKACVKRIMPEINRLLEAE